MVSLDNFYWHFGIREGGSDTADNIDAKFFIENYASLVRESLQNSLDAQLDEKQPVVVTYKYGMLEIPSESQFFEVEKYIEGCLSLHPNKNDRVNRAYRPMLEYIKEAKQHKRICFLEVSDSNTIGMDYTDDDENVTNTRFYSFAKSIGNSSKDNETRGGSYGLGKAVFYKNSSMRTIIISTKTENGAVAFEGIASLCTSKVDNKKREATGYFCDNDMEKPTTDEAKIPKAFQRDKCGTSIFIIGVDDNPINQSSCYDEIRKAVASHFWLSILHKKLVVNVGEETIDYNNIIDIATKTFSSTDEESPIPFIETVYYAESGNIDNYDKIEKDVPQLGRCLLYVHKEKKGSNLVLNMRKTEMLIYKQSMLKGYGYYGVFVCLGDKGNKILRMAEDPAHKTWNSNNCENNKDKSAAKLAIQEKNKFIKEGLVDCFGGQNENTSIISDLQNYLYMNVSENELEATRESVYGIHSGEKQEDKSTSQIPDLFPDTLPKEIVPETNDVKIFYIENNNADKTDTEDSNNHLEGGHGEGGGEDSNTHIQPLQEEEYVPNNDGSEKGTYLKSIRMKACAVYTKKTEGILYHFLRIIPGSNCDNMALDVYAVGDEEDSNDEIFIDEVSMGFLDGHNRICGLSAKEGERIEIRVRFEDNMSHPVTISAYEVTQI